MAMVMPARFPQVRAKARDRPRRRHPFEDAVPDAPVRAIIHPRFSRTAMRKMRRDRFPGSAGKPKQMFGGHADCPYPHTGAR